MLIVAAVAFDYLEMLVLRLPCVLASREAASKRPFPDMFDLLFGLLRLAEEVVFLCFMNICGGKFGFCAWSYCYSDGPWASASASSALISPLRLPVCSS